MMPAHQDVVSAQQRCGRVVLIGRPNVGKTTLLNRLVGEKLAATTRKPHTTRHRILGIITDEQDQIVLMDTPGIDPTRRGRLQGLLQRYALDALTDTDSIGFIVEAGRFTEGDAYILEAIRQVARPTILIINKIDRITDKAVLLPFMDERAHEHDYAAIVPLSAQTGSNLSGLIEALRSQLPAGPFLYDPEQLSDRPERFRVEEMIREALFERLGQELPYATAVQVESWTERGAMLYIDALIMVERDSQKGIVIGKGGQMLKRIGQAARLQLEGLLERRIMLQLTVRVERDWSQNPQALRRLGLDEGLG